MKIKKITLKNATDRKRLSGSLNLSANEMELLGCNDKNREVRVEYGDNSLTLTKIDAHNSPKKSFLKKRKEI